MVAPIITFVVAALLGFLTWKTSTIDAYMPPDNASVAESSSSTGSADEDAPADEPAADDSPAEEETE